ncbi:MAG: glycosyltransferase family 2 protein [bacterium]|nr:glycosyltransferase family 2 protein [bacterium]
MPFDYLKIASAEDLQGRDHFLYRVLEILPAFLSWGTLIILIIMSWQKPVWVSFFIIAFDIYWLLLVIFLGLHLIAAYIKLKKNIRIDWKKKCAEQKNWQDIYHIIILPVLYENEGIVRTALQSLIDDGFPPRKMIVVVTAEERAGQDACVRHKKVLEQYEDKFFKTYFTLHPDGIAGELKSKGANQAWAARQVKKDLIDNLGIPEENFTISVFDVDTIVRPGYFHRLTHAYLTVENRHRASYQPVPVYNNNLWDASFFARVAAMSNTFWQMMQQIRQEKLATYSSHSMSWQTLNEINFWSTNMVSEDSRIFWHCYLHFNGDYRVEPLYYPVSMDVVMDRTVWQSLRSLYKQQRRWGWGVENLPYLMFNAFKRRKTIKKRNTFSRILVQLYGFHSWATNALIIAVIGWLPLYFGGSDFTTTVLSGNLPVITRTLMTIAMVGLILSAVISTLLLPSRPKKYRAIKFFIMIIQWVILPVTIIFFGSLPALESQTRLALGGKWRLGFWTTPKER